MTAPAPGNWVVQARPHAHRRLPSPPPLRLPMPSPQHPTLSSSALSRQPSSPPPPLNLPRAKPRQAKPSFGLWPPKERVEARNATAAAAAFSPRANTASSRSLATAAAVSRSAPSPSPRPNTTSSSSRTLGDFILKKPPPASPRRPPRPTGTDDPDLRTLERSWDTGFTGHRDSRWSLRIRPGECGRCNI